MRFEKQIEEKFTVIKLLEEKLDATKAPALKGEFIMLNTKGVRNIILNLENVLYTDSSGLSAILTANRLCRDVNGSLILCSISSHIEKLIKISQLENTLYVLPTVEEAKEAIFMLELEREIDSEGQDQTGASSL